MFSLGNAEKKKSVCLGCVCVRGLFRFDFGRHLAFVFRLFSNNVRIADRAQDVLMTVATSMLSRLNLVKNWLGAYVMVKQLGCLKVNKGETVVINCQVR